MDEYGSDMAEVAWFLDGRRARLIRWVARCFRGVPVERVEDAVADAGVAALLCARAFVSLSEAERDRWLRVVARRCMRGAWRRRAGRSEVGGDALDGIAAAALGDSEAAVVLAETRGRLETAIRDAASENPRHGRRIAEALGLLADGAVGSVTEAAARVGVRREYVGAARCRARRRFQAPG